jgi:hypothetical protein
MGHLGYSLALVAAVRVNAAPFYGKMRHHAGIRIRFGRMREKTDVPEHQDFVQF